MCVSVRVRVFLPESSIYLWMIFKALLLFPHTIKSDWNSSRYMRSFSPCPLVNVSYRPPCANVRNAAIERPFYFIHTFSAFSSLIMCVLLCKAWVVCILFHRVSVCVCRIYTILNILHACVVLLHSRFYVPLSIENKIKREQSKYEWNEKWCQKYPGYMVLAYK